MEGHRVKGTRRDFETGEYNPPNALGLLPSGLTPDEHDTEKKKRDRAAKVKKRHDVTETLGPNVDTGLEETLSEKLAPNRTAADAKRPPRQPMNLGARIYIPLSIREEIEREGYTARLCLDKEDRLDRYVENYWEFHLDGKGDQIERRSGNGNRLVLMKLPKELFDEDNRLQQVARNAKYSNSNLLKAGYDAPNGSVLTDDTMN